MRGLRLWFIACALLVLSSIFIIPRITQAANFTAGTEPELVNAINTANANAATDVITLTADITLTATLPNILTTMTIDGDGHVISGDNNVRIFYVEPTGSLFLQDLNLADAYIAAYGGAIYNVDGYVNIDNVKLLGSYASYGAAIYNSITGILEINNSIFSENEINNAAGGAIDNRGSMTINDSTFYNNTGQLAGGAIANSGDMIINNSVFDSNNAVHSGGAIYIWDAASTTTITGSTFRNNSIQSDFAQGGAIFNDQGGHVEISSSIFEANIASGIVARGGGVSNVDGEITITDSRFNRNEVNGTAGNLGAGGGISNENGDVTIIGTTFTNNIGTYAGGIFNNIGTIVIRQSVFRQNRASVISVPSYGGGISNWAGTLTIYESTFDGNSASTGGGIYFPEGSLAITNSTFTRNFADLWGGGIFSGGGGLFAGGTLVVDNSTFSQNSATNSGSSITHTGIFFRLSNTIIANSMGGDEDCLGIPDENINNLIEDNSCGGVAAFTGDPKLGSLRGSPPYFPLLPDSPAVNAGDNTVCPSRDQSGRVRPANLSNPCDIGAYEAPLKNNDDDGGHEIEVIEAPQSTCKNRLNGNATVVSSGIENGSVQCQSLDAAGVGQQSVIDMGFIDAVDVYGYVELGATVCFYQSGSLVFLDAATSPRVISMLPVHIEDGMTCGYINRPGTVVLVEQQGDALQQAQSTGDADPVVPLDNCRVTTNYILNFRDAPDGELKDALIPYDMTLVAINRTEGWFNVIYGDDNGWISADLVQTIGSCGD